MRKTTFLMKKGYFSYLNHFCLEIYLISVVSGPVVNLKITSKEALFPKLFELEKKIV